MFKSIPKSEKRMNGWKAEAPLSLIFPSSIQRANQIVGHQNLSGQSGTAETKW